MGCEGWADQPWRTYVLSHGWDQSLSTAVDHNDRGPVGLCYVTAPFIYTLGPRFGSHIASLPYGPPRLRGNYS